MNTEPLTIKDLTVCEVEALIKVEERLGSLLQQAFYTHQDLDEEGPWVNGWVFAIEPPGAGTVTLYPNKTLTLLRPTGEQGLFRFNGHRYEDLEPLPF